mgnify:CR=1 FL=1
MGKLIVLMGSSATGKTTLLEYLKKYFNINIGVSHTSRPKRKCEIEGQDYHFISMDDFIDMAMSKDFLEVRTYKTKNGYWYYGLHKDSVDLSNGDYFVILDQDGYYQVLEQLPQEDVPGIYIYSDEREKISRALSRETRTDDEFYAEFYRRMLDDLTAFDKVKQDEHILKIENINLEQTARIIMNYIGLHNQENTTEK